MTFDSIKTTTIQRLHAWRNRLLESIPRTTKRAALVYRRNLLAAVEKELARRADSKAANGQVQLVAFPSKLNYAHEPPP